MGPPTRNTPGAAARRPENNRGAAHCLAMRRPRPLRAYPPVHLPPAVLPAAAAPLFRGRRRARAKCVRPSKIRGIDSRAAGRSGAFPAFGAARNFANSNGNGRSFGLPPVRQGGKYAQRIFAPVGWAACAFESSVARAYRAGASVANGVLGPVSQGFGFRCRGGSGAGEICNY